MSDVILVEDRGNVRLLTLNRPDKLNAFNRELTKTLLDAIRAADADQSVGAIVLTGAGRAFSAGADLKEAQAHAGIGQREAIRGSVGFTELYDVVMAIDKPVVAAVSGYAVGAGCALVMAADMAIAAESAILGYPEVKRGLAATAVTPTLVAAVGRKHASELLLLSENISARRAYEIGLVNRVTPDGETLDQAFGIANALAGHAPDALWMTKHMIRRSADLPLAQAHALARDGMLVMRGF